VLGKCAGDPTGWYPHPAISREQANIATAKMRGMAALFSQDSPSAQ
jgi:hypothetical protein